MVLRGKVTQPPPSWRSDSGVKSSDLTSHDSSDFDRCPSVREL